MTYDQWKTRSPDDEADRYWDDDYDDDPREDDCAHEEFEIDWEGRASCHYCGHEWWASEAQIEADIEHQRAYDEWQRQREQPWYRFKEWVGGHVYYWKSRWRRWRRKPEPVNDDVPF